MDVHIVLGSRSDMPVAEKAVKVLGGFSVEHTVSVASAHRDPEGLKTIVAGSDAKVFIAIAGLSAALPGAIASFTNRPVIGVPVSGKVNMDSILSIVQMPPGIPVGGVGLDRGDNAAVLAVRILALHDERLSAELETYSEGMRARTEPSVDME